MFILYCYLQVNWSIEWLQWLLPRTTFIKFYCSFVFPFIGRFTFFFGFNNGCSLLLFCYLYYCCSCCRCRCCWCCTFVAISFMWRIHFNQLGRFYPQHSNWNRRKLWRLVKSIVLCLGNARLPNPIITTFVTIAIQMCSGCFRYKLLA